MMAKLRLVVLTFTIAKQFPRAVGNSTEPAGRKVHD